MLELQFLATTSAYIVATTQDTATTRNTVDNDMKCMCIVYISFRNKNRRSQNIHYIHFCNKSKYALHSGCHSTSKTFLRLPNELLEAVFMLLLFHRFSEANAQEIQQPGAFPPGRRAALEL